ncbi:alpha-galactosidase [Streptococcus moroccensis]|uniref:Alpha-galactosidase n=1 Tax=Streptococcus moroccensis TaxID=1451356 RepID=A0ABT9YRV9_9STRE|nr:alpha-galactosidase [Streptococcus moroccensis]MDQ0222734.1 alpha-galactosidase [Streptococcus moroccensis]
MEKLIQYDPKQGLFHLSNTRISYLFSIEEGGLLSHLYFGQKIKRYHNQMRYPRIDRGFSGNVLNHPDRGFSKDTLPQEYSGSDAGDYRVPSFVAQHANGSRSNAWTFKDYKISCGKPVLAGLPASYVEQESQSETLVVTLEDKVTGLEIDLLYSIFRDYDVIARSSCVRNLGESSVKLEKISSMQIDFVSQDFDVICLPGAHANERHISRQKIDYGTKRFESRRGTSSHQMNPFIALVDKGTDEHSGQAFGLNFVYSGNHLFEVEKDQLSQVRVLAGINDYNFEWELKPGAHFQTPEVLMAYSNEGLNYMSQTFHGLIRNHIVRGRFKYEDRPILVNNWEATYFDFNEEKLKPIVDEAKELGMEMFVLDDGWFGKRDNDQSSLGDWQIYKKKFPNGLEKFADYVHQKGLKFGLWFEPEMISMDSNLYRNYPSYLMSSPNRQPSSSRSQFVLDMCNKEVVNAIYHQLKNILDKGYVDYIKWDMNRHLTDIYSPTLPPSRQGEVSHRYILGVYELLEKIINDYPNILFEGCSGGGGRFDTGWTYYMPQSWASDNTDAVARLTIQEGTSLAYPISSITSHVSAVPNHQTGRECSLEARGHVAMSGVLGYELDLTKMTANEKILVKEQVNGYKSVRHLVQYGTFYRLKSVLESNESAWLFVSENKEEALLMTANILSYAQPILTKTKLVGLNPDADYELMPLLSDRESDHSVGYFSSIYAHKPIAIGEVFSGSELMNIGIYNPIARQDFNTQMYYFKAKKQEDLNNEIQES